MENYFFFLLLMPVGSPWSPCNRQWGQEQRPHKAARASMETTVLRVSQQAISTPGWGPLRPHAEGSSLPGRSSQEACDLDTRVLTLCIMPEKGTRRAGCWYHSHSGRVCKGAVRGVSTLHRHTYTDPHL